MGLMQALRVASNTQTWQKGKHTAHFATVDTFSQAFQSASAVDLSSACSQAL
jgi:hypothetical protein